MEQRPNKIIQIGSQRRSGANYQAAANFIQSGKFGNITMVELAWNVNQPGRWRRPALVAQLKQEIMVNRKVFKYQLLVA